MATTFTQLIATTRTRLTETTAEYWTDAEILEILILGARDLWRRINDLYADYFITVDITNVTLSANTSTLSGVPTNLFRIVSIEPRILGETNPNAGLIFLPRPYNHPDFVKARAWGAIEPKNGIIFYAVFSAGPPVAAPTIRLAPQVSSAVNLTVVYNHALGTLVTGDNNPIPGEADNALIAWAVAYCRARERDDRAPDPEWLAIYGTEKTNLIQQLVPRQIQEPQVVEAFFMNEWDGF